MNDAPNETEGLSDEDKKLITLGYIIQELETELDAQRANELQPPQEVFLVFFDRFADCLKAIRLLTDNGLATQAKMVARHALECVVYMGALASKPDALNAFVAHEALQRREFRERIANAQLITQEQREQLDNEGDRLIEHYSEDIDALRDEIRAIKQARGWERTRTARELTLLDFSLLSEVNEVFKNFQNYLSPYVHVYFGNLFDDAPRDDPLSSPANDVVVLTDQATKQFDKLFASNLHDRTEKALQDHWPEGE